MREFRYEVENGKFVFYDGQQRVSLIDRRLAFLICYTEDGWLLEKHGPGKLVYDYIADNLSCPAMYTLVHISPTDDEKYLAEANKLVADYAYAETFMMRMEEILNKTVLTDEEEKDESDSGSKRVKVAGESKRAE